MTIEIYEDLRGEWRWRLTAENGRVMADGAEGYTRKGDASSAVVRILGEAADGQISVGDPE